MNPSHLLRVIRFDTTSLQANMGLELEIAKVQENPSDQRNNVVEFTSTASDKYPSLSMNGVTIGYVYDGDYDGVPYIMDPNDDDPNQPGSGGGPPGAMAGDPGMHGGFGGQESVSCSEINIVIQLQVPQNLMEMSGIISHRQEA